MFGPEGLVEAERDKGKIDHATAGAQIIWRHLHSSVGVGQFAVQFLAGSVVAHHNPLCLLDFVALDGVTPFGKRISKAAVSSHVDEAWSQADRDVVERAQKLLASPELLQEFSEALRRICLAQGNELLRQFHFGLLGRFLFSCLIDADRLSTANFEKPKSGNLRTTALQVEWTPLVEALERHITSFAIRNRVDDIRCGVSEACLIAATRAKGIHTLTVPTGGGKTLASLRFALHHARFHSAAIDGANIERIIYVIPYTTIIDQNASTVRAILGENNVIEHHSNLIPDKDTWRNRVLSENWDAPVVFTTSVQFLNALFARSTNNARRMHQLAKAVIIFDEIQCLPVKAVHLFNNAINFLVQTCGASVVLCTATQPTLGKVDAAKGAVELRDGCEIMPDVASWFRELKRTSVVDHRKTEGWTSEDISILVLEQLKQQGSVLVVVNTKASALDLFERLQGATEDHVYHLSTNMCPAHRKAVIANIKTCLDLDNPRPVICVSTQLIEAGVDIDFGCVVRYLAGLDSIAQAAGRCNRHGVRSLTPAPVFVVNPAKENTERLTDIQHGQQVSRRILDDFKADPESLDRDLTGPKAMRQFYDYYFFRRADEMSYRVSAKQNPKAECDFELLDLLSENTKAVANFRRTNRGNKPPSFPLRQAFATAAEAFEVIDAPTTGIVVPYGDEGHAVIAELASAYSTPDFPLADQVKLLRRAQQFSVNVFPNVLTKLNESGSVREVQDGAGIYYLDERHYHHSLGVTIEVTMKMGFLNA